MGKASRDKGARGERELVHLLADQGVAASRVASMAASAGNATGADVMVDGRLGVECKRVKRLSAAAHLLPYVPPGIPVALRLDDCRWMLVVPEPWIGRVLQMMADEAP